MGKGSAIWNENLVDIFCDLCMKEVDKENRPTTHLSIEGYNNFISNFSKETGRNYTKKQMKNKWDALKGEWKLWKELKEKDTGLGWDHKSNTIDASEEWWTSKIQANKELSKFRKKGIPHDFEVKLDKMFGGTCATGKHAYAPSSCLPLPSSPKQRNDNDILEDSGDSDDLFPHESTQVNKRKGQSVDDIRNEKGKGVAIKKGKVGGAAKLSQQIDRMCSVIESRSTATSMINRSGQQGIGTSIQEVMKVVTSLPGAETGTKLWFFATRLFLNQEKREMFTTIEDPNMKLAWLKFEMEEK